MSNNRNINFGSGGTYNDNSQNFQVQGDFVQGDRIQGNQIIGQDLNQTIIDIQQLLHQLQLQYSAVEAQQRAAIEIARQARSPQQKMVLMNLPRYIAENGGIEAGIGKVIELALKLVGI